MQFLHKYFDDHIEFPSNVAGNPIPVGVYWQYISSTFLNGFINYVKIIDATLMERYVKWEDKLDRGESYYNGGAWKEFKGTKQELFDLVHEQSNSMFHTKMHMFGDDVIILAKCEDNPYMYFLFWYDMDCSDCRIGKFTTIESEEVIKKDFQDWSTTLSLGYIDDEVHKQLPLHFFKGWLSG